MPTLVELIGRVDNLDEPKPVLNYTTTILGMVLSFQILTWLCVLFRLYTRFVVMKSPWWDDLFVLLSAVSTTAGGIGICVMTRTGMGSHFVLLSQDQIQGYLRAFYVANATYPGSTTLIKLALLLQYLRLLDRRTRLWACTLASIVFTALWGLAYSALAWVPTAPVDAYWILDKPAARYAYGTADAATFVGVYESHAAVNMVLDAVVLAIGVPLFFKPGMAKRSYGGLLALFLLGGVAGVQPTLSVNMLSIWRLQSIIETRATTLPTFDPTWYGPTPIVLSSLEVDLATVCASLPVFWPVIKKSLGPYIMVTHEVKITRESRHILHQDGFAFGRNNDGDDVELRARSRDSEHDGAEHLRAPPRLALDDGVAPYRNSFTSKQRMAEAECPVGRVTSVRVKVEAKGARHKEQ